MKVTKTYIRRILTPMRLPLVLLSALFAALSACSEFPALDDATSREARTAPYPDLVPIETLNAQAPEQRIEPETTAETQARIDKLKARAAKLQGNVIDDETRQRMQDGIE